ncbi:MAG: TonB-dependent receptor, partial [Bryobacterales bacterium]|nr:TonB-dependent receptor [Bryobacterales bacterium]
MFFKRILWIAAPVLAFASIFSDVKGIVHDPDHRPIAGAQVALRAANSEWSKATATGANGEFEFAAVPAGEYRVVVNRDGFAQIDERVMIGTGAAPVLHFQLKLAASRQTVEVSERADAVDTASATPTTFVDRRQIE